MPKESNLTKEKKKGRLLLVVCFIIMMVLCGGLGYLLGTSDLINPKVVSNGEKKEVKKAVKKESAKYLSVYDDVVIDNYSKVVSNYLTKCDDLKFFFNDKKVEVKDIDNQRAYATVMRKYGDGTNSEIPASQIKEDAKKIFGKDYDLTLTEELCNDLCINYAYNKASDSFTSRQTACGSACGPVGTEVSVSKAVIDGDNLIIDLKAVFRDYDESTNGVIYFGDYAKTKQIDSVNEGMARMKKGSDYRFTLKNEDGNYVFVSSEPIK